MAPDDADLRPPQQARSRKSLDRILETTERLLETRLMDELTLTEILREAGVSVGSFYGRFKSKEALIPELHTRYANRLDIESQRVFAPERWQGRTLRRRAALFVRYAMLTYRRQRGLLRALSLDWRIHPDRVVTPRVKVRRENFHRRLAGALTGGKVDITHPHVDAAVRFAITMVGAICRDQMLTSPKHPQPVDVRSSERWLGAQLERALIAYLEGPADYDEPEVMPPALPDPKSPPTKDTSR